MRFAKRKEIHEWAASEHVRTFLAETFGIKRIPCYWWLLSLLVLIRPESLNECMKQWVASVVPALAAKLETEEEEQSAKKKKQPLTIAIDGKAIRSTGKMKKIRQSLAYHQCTDRGIGIDTCPKNGRIKE